MKKEKFKIKVDTEVKYLDEDVNEGVNKTFYFYFKDPETGVIFLLDTRRSTIEGMN